MKMRCRRAMRPVGQVILAGAIAIVIAGRLASPAGAIEPDKYGWWNKAQQAPGGSSPVPAPPSVPSDGIYVANDPSGPAAIAALRYTVAEGGSGVLVLNVATGSSASGANLRACPTTSVWDEFLNGQWGGRPSYDCSNVFANGVVTPTGDQVTFEIQPAMQVSPGAVDVAIVPQGVLPFQIAFQKPDGSSLTGASLEPSSSSSPSPETAAAPAPESSPEPSPGDATLASGSPSFAAPALPSGGSAETQPASTGGPSSSSGEGGRGLTAPRRLVTDSGSGGERLMALGLLLAMGLTLWFLGPRPAWAARLLRSGRGRPSAEPAPAEAQTAYRVGGIGRFARARSVAPRRL